MSKDGDDFIQMKRISLSIESFERIRMTDHFMFEVTFAKNQKRYMFEVIKEGFNDNRRLVKINGVKGILIFLNMLFHC